MLNTAVAATQTPPRLLDRVRNACRVRHYSIRTEDAYHDWIKRFILFHGKRHAQEMGAAAVNTFSTDVALRGDVSTADRSSNFPLSIGQWPSSIVDGTES